MAGQVSRDRRTDACIVAALVIAASGVTGCMGRVIHLETGRATKGECRLAVVDERPDPAFVLARGIGREFEFDPPLRVAVEARACDALIAEKIPTESVTMAVTDFQCSLSSGGIFAPGAASVDVRVQVRVGEERFDIQATDTRRWGEDPAKVCESVGYYALLQLGFRLRELPALLALKNAPGGSRRSDSR